MKRIAAFLVTSMMGCSAAYTAAQRGQEALDRGDVEGAMGHYFSACRQSSDSDWCDRANRLYNDMLDSIVAQATPLCGTPGSEQRCLETLKRLRKFRDDPGLAALADAAGKTWLASCRKNAPVTPIDAVVRVRCIEATREDMMSDGYNRQADEDRRVMSAFLAAESSSAASKGLTSSAYGLAELARCFSRATAVDVDAARRSAVAPLQVRTTVAADGIVSSSWVCGQIERSSDGRLVCTTEGSSLGIRVGLRRGELMHDYVDTPHSVTYVAERRQYDNPEWFRADAQREEAENRLRRRHRDAQLAADECGNARSDRARANYCYDCYEKRIEDRACKHASSLESFWQNARRELSSAEHRLNNTARYLIQEIKAQHRYIERTHSWRQAFQVYIHSSTAAVRAREGSFELHRSGLDRAEFQPAGIEASVALEPSQASLDSEAAANLTTTLANWTKDTQTVFARAKEVECLASKPEVAGTLECVASVGFLRGEDPGRVYVAALGKEADKVANFQAARCAP